jgi:O-antigen/teichoic acid export membrane protein
MRGGAYLALRQAVGMVVGFFATLYVSRRIGPGAFGLVATSNGVYQFCSLVGQWGLNVYLIRHHEEVAERHYHQVASLLLVCGLTLGLAGALIAPLWEVGFAMPGLAPIVVVTFGALPLELITLVPLARLERALSYQQVAVVDFAATLASQLTAVGLAMAGAGPWSLVAAFWGQSLIKSTGYFRLAHYWPRWNWDWPLIREMMAYGFGFSFSGWLWQVRTLVNPIVVGRLLGAEAVGQVALAIRFVETLSFVRTATWRLSVAVLARMQGDRDRLLRAINQGMRLQTMAVGIFLAAFAVAGPPLLAWMLGRSWELTFAVFPFIALGALIMALFGLHASVLYACRRNWEVAVIALVQVIGLAGGTALLVPTYGAVGYGGAELVAISAYGLAHYFVRRRVGRLDYGPTLWWFVPLAGCLFAPTAGWWSTIGLAVLAVRKGTWIEVRDLVTAFRQVTGPNSGAALTNPATDDNDTRT